MPLALPGNVNRLPFGPVSVEWSSDFRFPIAVQHLKLNGHTVYVTLTRITFKRGGQRLRVRAGYEFDGASVPRPMWGVPGFSPIGLHLWAALAHDWICDHPDELDRVIGDAIFLSLLKHTGVPWQRRLPMYLAVRMWSTWRAVKALFSHG
jgi:hypothetical protein